MRKRDIAMVALCAWVLQAQTTPDVSKIIAESARTAEADRQASLEYDYKETDLEKDGSKKTYMVHMLEGSPYNELIAVNGQALPKAQADEEKRKLEQETSRRRAESPDARAKRVAQFQKEQDRDSNLFQEFVGAFDFKLLSEQQLDGHQVYVIQATPKVGYHPPDRTAEVLTGMRGQLWIDTKTNQWVKVEAEVTHPVEIDGFLAKVERGTRFELEKMPVVGGVWLPKHFSMTAKAKILDVIYHKQHQDETYSDYRKIAPVTRAQK